MPTIVAVDVDGVVAALEIAWLSRYNRDWNDTLTREDWVSWDVTQFVKPECGAAMYDYLDDPTLYDDVPPVPGALRGVRMLRAHGYRVIFVTSTVNKSAGRKLRWLQDHGFLPVGEKTSGDYVECHDKSLIDAFVMVDDGAHNLTAFLSGRARHNHRALGLLMDQPWNRNERLPLGAIRVYGWSGVTRILCAPEGRGLR